MHVHRARDRIEYESALETLESAIDTLDLSTEVERTALELFLADVPAEERSRVVAVAASVYAGSLIAGEECPQGAVAAAVGVSRLSIQQTWKDRLEAAGLEPPAW